MNIREEVQNQFNELCITPSDDVLDKCSEICILNNVDPEEFVETWMAYSLTHLNGAEPTLDAIQKMHKKEFAERKVKIESPKHEEEELNIYTTPKSNNVLGADNSTTPKSVKTKTINRSIGFSQSPRTAFTPASYSPDVGKPCTNYEGRTNSGQSVLTHGEKRDVRQQSPSLISLKVWTPADGGGDVDQLITCLDHRLMMENVSVKGDIWSDRIDTIGRLICEQSKLGEPTQYTQSSSDKLTTYGRIVSAEGRLQMKSVQLESSEPLSRGRKLELIMHELTAAPVNPCTGLFPGQVVAVQGTCPMSGKMAVQSISSPAPPALPPVPTLTGPLKIAVAAAPFTQADNLLYQPLEDFVKYLKNNDPHVAIIIGPIADAAHSMVADVSIAETFSEFHDEILKGIVAELTECKTQLVYVVSARDAAQTPIYPTIPITDKIQGLTMVSDPSILNISGLIVGISSTDVLMHLSKEELALSGHGDRLGRLASHLITQHNFYPLYPPNEEVAIDSSLWETQSGMPISPHILVLPSDLRYFIKNVGPSVVVNPERLAKGQAGGSFAMLEIYPSENSDWSPSTHIHGEILKI
ncbi:DNA polymerase alpha subunit B [Nilaparvata lugens]|uniref:DNA polymerase alpha subunit B n=1 Tax=Nilaparvata lugens TaxID=108931 RepID=UPI000B97E4F5|nr:DNA polymerase alpha subunit B [Nilaparvata lugens]